MRLLFLLFAAGPAFAQNQLAREIFKELININTVGNTTPAVKVLEARFRDAGFLMRISRSSPRRRVSPTS